MGYIVITLLAIFVTTVIVYKLANNVFKLNMRLRPLVLCAACALLISLVLPRMVVGFAGLTGTVAVLAIFAIIFAYFIAYYDEETEAAAEPEFAVQAINTSTSAVTASNLPHTDNNIFTTPDFCHVETVMQTELTLDTVIQNDENAIVLPVQEATMQATSEELSVNIKVEKSSTEIVAEIEDEEEIEDKTNERNELENDKEESVNIIEDSVYSLLQETEETNKKEIFINNLETITEKAVIQEEDTETIAAKIAPSITEDTVTVSVLLDEECVLALATEITLEQIQQEEQQIANEENYVEEATIEEVTVGENGGENLPDTLDELFELAFARKEVKDYIGALAAFTKALLLNPDNNETPFIIIQISNIMKNQGAYDDAIQMFASHRNLNCIKNDEMLEQEFISTIAYLRVIKNILLEHHLANTAFAQIPPDILKEIDNEYREWRNMAYQS